MVVLWCGGLPQDRMDAAELCEEVWVLLEQKKSIAFARQSQLKQESEIKRQAMQELTNKKHESDCFSHKTFRGLHSGGFAFTNPSSGSSSNLLKAVQFHRSSKESSKDR